MWGPETKVRSLHPGHLVGREGNNLKLSKSEVADLQQTEWSENHTQTIRVAALHTTDRDTCSQNVQKLGTGAWGLDSNPTERIDVDYRERAQEEKGYIWGESMPQERENSGWRMPLEESRAAMEAWHYC